MNHSVTLVNGATTTIDGRSVTVLAVGPWGEREFDAIGGSRDWKAIESIREAHDLLREGELLPEVILIAQPLPDSYRQADIDRLLAVVPLARPVIVAGSWCEGQFRTGTQLLGTVRMYWYDFPGWWRTALERAAIGLCPPWSVPLDGPYEGRFGWGSVSFNELKSKLVAIETVDFAVYQALRDGLSYYGLNSVWHHAESEVDYGDDLVGGIWDGGQLGERELRRLRGFARNMRTPSQPLIVLLDFPRREHFRQAQQAGATAVFGKPYVLDDLAGVVVRHVRSPG